VVVSDGDFVKQSAASASKVCDAFRELRRYAGGNEAFPCVRGFLRRIKVMFVP
jgi:hypothetical protein